MTRDELEKLNYDELKHQFYNKITSLKKDYLFYYDSIEILNKELVEKVHKMPNYKDMTLLEFNESEFKEMQSQIDLIRTKISISQSMMETTEKTIEKLRAISNLTI